MLILGCDPGINACIERFNFGRCVTWQTLNANVFKIGKRGLALMSGPVFYEEKCLPAWCAPDEDVKETEASVKEPLVYSAILAEVIA